MASAAESGHDWSFLPSDVIILLAKRLGLRDVGRLPAVCVFWAWAMGRPRSGWPPPPVLKSSVIPDGSVPWILLFDEKENDAHGCSFLELSSDPCGSGVVRRRISPLPELRGCCCIGSSPGGWIVTLDLDLNTRILNPLTREELPLPSLLTLPHLPHVQVVRRPDGAISYNLSGIMIASLHEFRNLFVRKIILTSAPPSAVAVAITGGTSHTHLISFARVGDPSWSPSPGPVPDPDSEEDEFFSWPVMDAVYQNKIFFSSVIDAVYRHEDGKLYVVNRDSGVATLDLEDHNWESPSPPKFTILRMTGSGLGEYQFPDKYFVVLAGDLLQIETHYCYTKRRVCGEDIKKSHLFYRFEVFKFDPYKKDEFHKFCYPADTYWVPVYNLGDFSVFIGYNKAFALNVAGKQWLKPNCIYFIGETNINDEFIHDAGVFDLKRRTLHRFPTGSCLFFMPSLLCHQSVSFSL